MEFEEIASASRQGFSNNGETYPAGKMGRNLLDNMLGSSVGFESGRKREKKAAPQRRTADLIHTRAEAKNA